MTGPLRRILAAGLGVVLGSGCTVGPDYVRPGISMPDAWRVEPAAAQEMANAAWWESFEDPVLVELVETALAENQDVRIAAARVDEFLGALQTTRSRFYPQADYSGGATRGRSPQPIPGVDPYYTQYQAAAGAAWQVDLFGRVRRQSEAAQARLMATEQARRGVILTVVTSVAANYVALVGLDAQLEIARATARNFAETLEVFELRYAKGVVSKLEVSQVRSQQQQAEAAIPRIEARIAAQENLLSVLLGRPPGPIIRGRQLDALTMPGIPGALPASLLERRPDVVQAEQNLIAANADVGATRALYYPDLSITGAFGAVSDDLGDFLDTAARSWNVGASLTGPIFTAGRIAGQEQSAEAARAQALETYRRTVLNALREVNDALAGTVKDGEAYDALRRRAEALREYARLSALKFDAGASSYLEVLYASNELFTAELDAIAARVAHFASLIDVYKSMGGGWVDRAAELAPGPDEVVSRD